MKLYRSLLLLALTLTFSFPALAGAGSPVGLWRTIDDQTGKVRSLLRIVEVKGELQGTVEKIFPEGNEDRAPVCRECKGERKDKPIVGMNILWGMKKDGNEWSGGEILDPKNGKTYRCKITLSDDGKSLTVRGFIGLALFGRSQTWQRQE
jgi:uncharacterized protein (DUF2147 family)